MQDVLLPRLGAGAGDQQSYRSRLVCRLQLMGTEAVSDELLVPHSWEILEDEQGITLIDSHLGSVLPWGEFGFCIPRKG